MMVTAETIHRSALKEQIALHLYRRGAWTLDVCRKVAGELETLTGEGDVPVGWRWRAFNEETRKPTCWVYWESKPVRGDNLTEDADVEIEPLYAAPHPPRQDGLCSDCPPVGYPTDKTRCLPCPRRQDGAREAAQFLPTEDGEFNGNAYEGELSPEELAMIDQAWEIHKAALPVATVINDNQPGWTAIIETAPNVTLPVGTKLYAEPKIISLTTSPAPDEANIYGDWGAFTVSNDQTMKDAIESVREGVRKLTTERDQLRQALQQAYDRLKEYGEIP